MKKVNVSIEELESIFSKETIDEFAKANIKGGEESNGIQWVCGPNPPPLPQDQACIPRPVSATACTC